jgi:hypothetical protein
MMTVRDAAGSGCPAPHRLPWSGLERPNWSGHLLVDPVTHDRERAVTIEREGAHQIGYGAIHVGATVGSEFSKETKEPFLLVRGAGHPRI